MDVLKIQSLRFAPDFSFARTSAGNEIRFSKHERRLLGYFTRHPLRILTRNALLNAISPNDEEVLDRNIDYLISRLRKKLGDSSKDPHFINTVYGEGYRWIARVEPIQENGSGELPLLLIRPLWTGVDQRQLAQQLHRQLVNIREIIESRFDKPVQVLLATETDRRQGYPESIFVLDCSTLRSGNVLRCSSVLRDGRSAHIYESWSQSIELDSNNSFTTMVGAELGRLVHGRILSALLERPALSLQGDDQPLAVSIDQAAQLFSSDSYQHDSVNQALRGKLRNAPDDHITAITLATSLHVSIVLNDIEDVYPIRDEIESLLVEHVAGVQNHPVYLSATAKLLYFVGHLQMAEQMAERALDLSPSHPAVLMVYGSLKAYGGNLSDAINYYDFALASCEAGSQFQAMIWVLKATAARALGDMDETAKLVRQISDRDDSVRLLMNFAYLGDDVRIDPEALAAAPLLNPGQWQAIVKRIYQVTARQFVTESLRETALNGILHIAHQHAGPSCLIEELATSVPSLYVHYAQESASA